jgi:hypothetical protein
MLTSLAAKLRNFASQPLPLAFEMLEYAAGGVGPLAAN